MNELKNQYNVLIKAENEIGLWLDDPTVPIELKEPHIPKFVELTKKLSKLLNQMTEEGLHYTDDEALFGFKE